MWVIMFSLFQPNQDGGGFVCDSINIKFGLYKLYLQLQKACQRTAEQIECKT